jgi:hypothetical protein
VLDPNSSARNFDTSGQNPDLYYTRSHYYFTNGSCFHLLDRDLDRVPFQFTGTGAAAAAASFTASSDPVPAGSAVTFDASSSRTVGDTTATYRWDLDGDGSFETGTGTSPLVKSSYEQPRDLTVGLQVTDELGDTMQARHDLKVLACGKRRGACKPNCHGHGHRSCR